MREDLRPAPALPVSAHQNWRRSTMIAAAVSVVAVIVASLAGHPWLGVFIMIGLALGALNTRLLQLSVLRYALTQAAPDAKPMTKKRLSYGVLMRLGAITLLAFGFALLVRPDGFGIFAGLAVFQVLMLVGAALPVFRSLRPTS